MDIEAIYQKGFDLRCEGRYGEAQVEFSKVLQLQPGHLGSQHQIGLIQGFLGDFDASIETLRALTVKNPTNLELRYDLAMTEMMLGYQDEACANFKYILSVDPTHAKAKQQAIYC